MTNLTVVGRLTKDLEQQATTGGTIVARSSIAYTMARDRDTAMYLDFTAFGKTAELMIQYLGKGHQVMLCGELKHGRWEKDGNKHSKHELIVNSMKFLSKPDGAAKPQQQQQQAPAPAPQPDTSFGMGAEPVSDSEIPF